VVSDVRGPIVRFDDATARRLRGLAADRWEPKRDGGQPTEKVATNERDHTIDIAGVRGEYAVAQYLDGSFTQVTGRRARRDFHSITLADGTTIYVSSPITRDRYFVVKGTNPHRFTADIGILVWPASDAQGEAVELVGWLPRDEWFAPKPGGYEIKNFGYGDTLAYHWDKLHPMACFDLRPPASLIPSLDWSAAPVEEW
jgi:hypothetical protein